ncbi:hypothetical protein C4N9_05960 [Pararhodobacter marinus]|uniref:Uncharacterized protein n=1 Tax=Pararhodobacter marinus TaxID=2184063 RepID=A0A2U2CEF6_9RHOB|nr:hypothetical protein C4N9_05960 [Pararhodobacter marinus]
MRCAALRGLALGAGFGARLTGLRVARLTLSLALGLTLRLTLRLTLALSLPAFGVKRLTQGIAAGLTLLLTLLLALLLALALTLVLALTLTLALTLRRNILSGHFTRRAVAGLATALLPLAAQFLTQFLPCLPHGLTAFAVAHLGGADGFVDIGRALNLSADRDSEGDRQHKAGRDGGRRFETAAHDGS